MMLKWVFGTVLLASGLSLADAARLFGEGKYPEAVAAYRALLVEHPGQSRIIQFNIAQCYRAQDSVQQAARIYEQLLGNLPVGLESQALNNLGLLSIRQNREQQALTHLRNAILRDPTNETARYNYELLKKRLEQNPPPPFQPPPPQDLPPPSGRPDPPPPTEQLGALPEEQLLTAAEARAALQRLAQRKVQFVQQLKKRSTEPARYSDMPNW